MDCGEGERADQFNRLDLSDTAYQLCVGVALCLALIVWGIEEGMF